MTEIEIGRAKRARPAYALDDIAIVPSRRTRDPEAVSVAWQHRRLPLRASRCSPRRWTPWSRPRPRSRSAASAGSACSTSTGSGRGTTTPQPLLARDRRAARRADVTPRLQEIYAAPIREDLIAARIAEIRAGGVTVAGRALAAAHRAVRQGRRRRRRRPLRHPRHHRVAPSTCRARVAREPLNLKQFIYELDVPVIVGGCATYQAALHLMRTGAAGVLVGFGGGAAHTTRDVLGVARADGLRDRRRRRRAPRLHGRVRRPLRARHRRRRRRPLRRPRQGDRLRRRRRDGRLAARPRRRGARPRLPLGHRGRTTPSCRAASASQLGTVGTLERDPARPVARRRRHDEPRRRAAPRDGHDRLLRPQGVPARRGRRQPDPTEGVPAAASRRHG